MASVLKSAFVVGYTGATGKELVKELAKSNRFERVVLIGRRRVDYDNEDALNNFEQRVIDFENLSELKEEFSGFDVGFSCLGTGKDGGSVEAFKRVECDYIRQIALNCKEGGTKHFHYISMMGASANRMFVYGRVKGETEAALADVAFERLSVYRPMLLKHGEPTGFVEKVFSFFTKPIQMITPSLIETPCDLLARAMINNCDATPSSSNEILENDAIYRLAEDTSL